MSKSMTTAQIVAEYNAIAESVGEKPVKRFSTRAVAERRLKEIQARARPAAFDPDAIGEKRGLRFDLPGRPAKDRVAPREGSMRAKLLGMLQDAGKDGIDFEELHKACGFLNRKSTRDALGLLSRKNGYGIKGTDAQIRLLK